MKYILHFIELCCICAIVAVLTSADITLTDWRFWIVASASVIHAVTAMTRAEMRHCKACVKAGFAEPALKQPHEVAITGDGVTYSSVTRQTALELAADGLEREGEMAARIVALVDRIVELERELARRA